MAETTRTLITDEDLDCLDTLKTDGTMSASDLYVLAPRLRARWVAEALEQVESDLRKVATWTDSRQLGRLREDIADDLARLAAEYRDGTR